MTLSPKSAQLRGIGRATAAFEPQFAFALCIVANINSGSDIEFYTANMPIWFIQCAELKIRTSAMAPRLGVARFWLFDDPVVLAHPRLAVSAA